MRLSDLQLKKKLAIAFTVVMLILVAVNVFTILRMSAIRDDVDNVTSDWLPSALAIAAINSNTSDLRIAQLQYLHASSDSVQTRLAEVMISLIDRINLNRDAFEPLISTDQERELYARFDERWEAYINVWFEYLSVSASGDTPEASRLLNVDAQRVFGEMSAVLEELVLVNQASSFEAAQRAEETFRNTRRVARTVLGITFIIAILIAWWLARWITVPVRQLATAANDVGQGRLDVQVKLQGRDEIGLLADAFNQMTGHLREARDKIEAQQARLWTTNEELEQKNNDLEEAMHQLREAQQQLVMREKMASLGNLVAGVAHEINNPVGAVSSAADTSARSLEIIKRLMGEGGSIEDLVENQRFKTALEILESNNAITVTASERITQIVRSLKNFARLDESEFQEADLHEGLDSTLTLLHHELKKRVEVVTDYGDDVPRVQCYPNQLNQVFMNMLSNASHAIGETGVITVRTRREGQNVVIEISDTGRGIKKENLERIFDPGFTTKGVGVGTGLGLSISYNIVKRHHGTIEADSVVGRGTTMRIRLPISQPEPNQ
jgi:signal transduction histidine kinase